MLRTLVRQKARFDSGSATFALLRRSSSAPLSNNARLYASASSSEKYKTSQAKGEEGKLPLVEDKTVRDIVEGAAERLEHRDAFIAEHQYNTKLTFLKLNENVDNYANGFGTIRTHRKLGDCVGLMLPDDTETFLLQLATGKAGVRVACMDPLASQEAIEHTIKSLKPKAVIVPQKVRGRDNIDFFTSKIVPELADWPVYEVPFKSKKFPSLRFLLQNGSDREAGFIMLRDMMWVDATPSQLPNPGVVKPDETFISFHTKHSIPRAAAFSHRSVINSAAQFGSVLGLTIDDRVCFASPLQSALGFSTGTLACLTRGSVVVLSDHVFTPERVLKTIERDSCTWLHCTAPQLQAILQNPLLSKVKLNTLKKIVVVNDPQFGGLNTEKVSQLAEEALASLKLEDVVIAHGTTEAGGAFLHRSVKDGMSSASAGKLLPHVEAKVVDNKGTIVKPGVSGKLYVKGYNTMQKYWEDDAATKQVLGADGWLDTGLPASMSASGDFTLA
ncbi:hypothetical protein QOT17_001479 [Balamuthia mandrillaris]